MKDLAGVGAGLHKSIKWWKLLAHLRASGFQLSVTASPADLVECMAITWEVLAAQRRPRNSTQTLIKLRQRATEPIISTFKTMEVGKMLHISRRSSPFSLRVGAPDTQLGRA